MSEFTTFVAAGAALGAALLAWGRAKASYLGTEIAVAYAVGSALLAAALTALAIRIAG